MSSKTIFSKAADVLHRGAVLGLVSAFGFQFYQIMSKTLEGRVDSPHMHSTYLKGEYSESASRPSSSLRTRKAAAERETWSNTFLTQSHTHTHRRGWKSTRRIQKRQSNWSTWMVPRGRRQSLEESSQTQPFATRFQEKTGRSSKIKNLETFWLQSCNLLCVDFVTINREQASRLSTFWNQTRKVLDRNQGGWILHQL